MAGDAAVDDLIDEELGRREKKIFSYLLLLHFSGIFDLNDLRSLYIGD